MALLAPEDSENEVKHMRPGIGECIAFDSIWYGSGIPPPVCHLKSFLISIF